MKRLYAILTVALAGAGVVYYDAPPARPDLPQLVRIPAGPYAYRPAGDFRIGTRVVDAPLQQRVATDDFEIMKYPVSQSDYAACVAESGCFATTVLTANDLPQTETSFTDAIAYARWFSDKTGEIWRLPTDEEWVRAAGDRYRDEGLGADANGTDPSKRWLAQYRSQVEARGEADPTIHPRGSYGENNLGVADISGNVWEWTTSCFQNGTVSADGKSLDDSADYCGVRAVQGKHRAFIIDFVRDAKVGGCAVGIPPDFLGFRLVRGTGRG